MRNFVKHIMTLNFLFLFFIIIFIENYDPKFF